METNFIEKLNKSRYNSILITTIGLFIYNGSFMFKHLNRTHWLIPALLGVTISVVGTIKILKVEKLIKSNAKAREVLNDELYKHNTYKSLSWGFWATLAIAGLLTPISWFYDLSGEMVCQLILFTALAGYFISFLIYNRDTY